MTTFIFAGGGTGGHIFPALGIAEALVAARPGSRLRFLVSQRPLDAEILGKERLAGAPADFCPIPAQPFSLRPGAFLRFITWWGASVRAGREAIRAARAEGPVVVVAMGGFVAAPVVQAARVEKVPAILINLDAVPGKANRWIAQHVRRVLTAAPLSPGHERPGWEAIPPIVRAGAVCDLAQAECRREFGLVPDRPTLLVTGGSQGAGSVNALLGALAAMPDSPMRGWQVIHQSGKGAAEEVRATYRQAGVGAWVGEFIDRMGVAWGAADLAVSRAGAGSVAEAWANRVPTLFMPYPYHRDQHQSHNARVLVEAGGAVLAADLIDPGRNVRGAGEELRGLLADVRRREAMRKALEGLGPAEGAARAAEAVMSL
ncbi:UDP-N-acetylglucosamine--N-acetylmuramyl-(pentapeptide) pyrophosphoryl-undecaprenol N-acetylglucosamine transferase [Phycisphaerales bacterium]|nr:UDP-N-acetylglucosamine--N-acetylmuramyl-(pentapeptide) pyrophosphoryl-undecaprenol N-acetylglucosamine transferase [Phycisphaerales bacterium]